MALYKVNIIEHNEKQVALEAESAAEAEDKAAKLWESGNILFDDYTDHCWQEFTVERE